MKIRTERKSLKCRTDGWKPESPWTLELWGMSCLKECVNVSNGKTPPSPLGAGHRVVVDGLSNCEDSYLTGEARSRPGVTVAGGPRGSHRVWEGTPTRAHGRRIMESNCTISLPRLLEGPRCMLLLVRERLHRVHSRLVSPGLELVVSLKTAAPTTSHHRVPAATAATADRLVRCLGVA